MKEISKTLVFLGLALVLSVLAYNLAPTDNFDEAIFSEQGEAFFPEFKDPLAAASLEVFSFNEELGNYIPFKVERRNNQWVIPSHSNYPVDAKEKMEKVAANLVGLIKNEVRSAQAVDHQALGVIDPTDESNSSFAGRGMRIKVKDQEGNILCHYILGKVVEGKQGYRFVREPGKNMTYAVKVDLELSIRFADWVNTELLEMESAEALELAFNNYTVSEGRPQPGESFKFKLQENKWSSQQ